MIMVSDIFRHTPDLRIVAPDVTIVGTRSVGIEVEVENARGMDSSHFWSCITDHSLRNHGAELVMRAPLGGADLRNALNDLRGTLRKHPNLHCSERTSLHVHIDVRDLSLVQVRNILATYTATEAALYKMSGKSRYDNIYCPGITSALAQIGVMRRVMSDYTFEGGVYDWCKYTGINLHSISERGSIEFRSHEGTTDVRRIMQWTNILLTLVEYAISQPSPESILADANKGASVLLTKVYGRFANLLAGDGEYEQYYKNNLTNLIDLLDAEEFEFTKSTESPSDKPTDDLSFIISQLRDVVSTAGGAA